MNRAMQAALREYGRVIRKNGWRAGENLIKKYSKQWPDFRKWAMALCIVLRAEELLKEDLKKKK